MSIGPNVPRAAPTALADDHNDRDILESLSGLSIKGFQDCLPTSIMHTPSSTNTSLPTPPALKSSIVILVTPSPSRSVYPPEMDSMDIADSTQSAGDDWCPLKSTLQTPGVPLLKDLDSFTNGTGHSSFNFLDPVGPNTGMLFYHSMEESSPAHQCDTQDAHMDGDDSPSSIPANSLALDLLPSPANLEEFVQAWREKIEPSPPPQDTPVAKKRRRSLTLDSSCADEHRPRVWSPTTEFSHTARPDMREAYSLAGCTDHAPPD